MCEIKAEGHRFFYLCDFVSPAAGDSCMPFVGLRTFWSAVLPSSVGEGEGILIQLQLDPGVHPVLCTFNSIIAQPAS